MLNDRTKRLWGLFLVSLVATPALASDHLPGQVLGRASCATAYISSLTPRLNAARWSDELPDNTDDGWNDVPFDPDKFWEYLRGVAMAANGQSSA